MLFKAGTTFILFLMLLDNFGFVYGFEASTEEKRNINPNQGNNISFETFLGKSFDLLIKFSPRRLKEYCTVFAISLKDSKYENVFLHKLHCYLDRLCKRDGLYISTQVQYFIEKLKKNPNHIAKVLLIYNRCTAKLGNIFNDYLQDLESFRNGSIIRISEPTHKVVEVIYSAIENSKRADVKTLEKTLADAVAGTELDRADCGDSTTKLNTLSPYRRTIVWDYGPILSHSALTQSKLCVYVLSLCVLQYIN